MIRRVQDLLDPPDPTLGTQETLCAFERILRQTLPVTVTAGSADNGVTDQPALCLEIPNADFTGLGGQLFLPYPFTRQALTAALDFLDAAHRGHLLDSAP